MVLQPLRLKSSTFGDAFFANITPLGLEAEPVDHWNRICRHNDDDGYSDPTQCSACECWQHMVCMGLFDREPLDYHCHECLPNSHLHDETIATLDDAECGRLIMCRRLSMALQRHISDIVLMPAMVIEWTGRGSAGSPYRDRQEVTNRVQGGLQIIYRHLKTDSLSILQSRLKDLGSDVVAIADRIEEVAAEVLELSTVSEMESVILRNVFKAGRSP